MRNDSFNALRERLKNLSVSSILFGMCMMLMFSCDSGDLDEMKDVDINDTTNEPIESDEYATYSYRRSIWLSSLGGLDSPQSIALYEDSMVALYYGATMKIFNLKTKSLEGSVKLPYEPYSHPHSNTICFGKDCYSKTDKYPLLYVSQWYVNSENGVLVFRIFNEEGKYDLQFLQLIRFDTSLTGNVGQGPIDWVVDTDHGELYSLAYSLAGEDSYMVTEDNATVITRCRLPNFTEGKEVILKNEDIKDRYELEVFQYSQDKAYHNGHIYALAGYYVAPESISLRDIDLTKRKIVSKIDLSEYGGEPEGLSISRDGDLVFTWVDSSDLYTFSEWFNK